MTSCTWLLYLVLTCFNREVWIGYWGGYWGSGGLSGVHGWLTSEQSQVGPGCLTHFNEPRPVSIPGCSCLIFVNWMIVAELSRNKQQHNNSFGFLVSPLYNQSQITESFSVVFDLQLIHGSVRAQGMLMYGPSLSRPLNLHLICKDLQTVQSALFWLYLSLLSALSWHAYSIRQICSD